MTIKEMEYQRGFKDGYEKGRADTKAAFELLCDVRLKPGIIPGAPECPYCNQMGCAECGAGDKSL